jgi:hypothetical protein
MDQCFVEMGQAAKLLRKITSHGVMNHTALIFASIAPFCDRFEHCSYEMTEQEYNQNPDPYVQHLIQACATALHEVKVCFPF